METLDFVTGIDNKNLPFSLKDRSQIKNVTEEGEYQEIFVKSFTEAVDVIEKDQNFKDDEFNLCLLDIDGVIFENNMVKLPIASHFANPKVTESSQSAYNRLLSISNGNIVISTNRSENERMIFNSQNVLKQVKNLVNSNDKKIPIFTGLFKQRPGMTVENISNIHQDDGPTHIDWSDNKVIKPRVDAIVNYIGKLATEQDYAKYHLTSIEDWSIVSLNRKDFLLYVATQLKQQYGIEIEGIRNYVIKR